MGSGARVTVAWMRARARAGSPKEARTAALVAAARRLTVPVPRAVLEKAAPGAKAADLAALAAAGTLLADDRGYLRANPLRPALPGERRAGPKDALRLSRAIDEWLAAEPFARDAEMVEGARLAVLAGDEARAAAWLERLAHAAVVSGTAPEAVAALLASGLVGEFLRAAREPTLLLLVDGARFAEARAALRPDERWLDALLHVRAGTPREAFTVLPATVRRDVRESIVLARACIDVFEPARAVDLLEPHLAQLPAGTPQGLVAQVQELLARAYRLVGRFDDALAVLGRLAALADRLGEGRFQPAVHMGRAIHAYYLGRMRESREHLARLHECLRRLPPSRYAARADLLEASIALYAGAHDACSAAIRRALSSERPDFREYWLRLDAEERALRGDFAGAREILSGLESSPTSAVLLADMAMQEGDVAELRRRLADPHLEPVDSRVLRRRAAWLTGEVLPPPEPAAPSLYLVVRSKLWEAEIAIGRGDLAAGTDVAREAISLADRHDLGMHAADAWLLLADAAMRGGDVTEARRLLDRAGDRIAHPGAPAARLLAAARHACAGTSPAAADMGAAARAKDWRTLCALCRDGSDRPTSVTAFLDSIPERLRAIGAAAFPANAPTDALLVGPDARWFRLAGGKRVDLGRRRAVRLLFLRLAEVRVATPGRALGMDDLLEAGWAGERVIPEAGWNRVYVALNTLRTLGLKAALVTRDDGWLLDPEVPLLRVAEPAMEAR